MNIWSKVFVVLIMLSGLGFFYTAARTLKTHEAWRSKVNQHEAALAQTQQQIEATINGDPAQGVASLKGLKAQLADAIAGRGRVWYGAAAGQVDPNTGAVTVTIDQPDPHRIDPTKLLYAFDDTEFADGGRYLGEFRVTQAADGQQAVTIEPTLAPSAREKQKLIAASGRNWSLFETMPLDRRDLFAGLSDEEIQRMLPPAPQQEAGETPEQFQQRVDAHKALVDEFLRDGDEPRPGDPDDRIYIEVQFTKNDQSAVDALARLRIPDEQKISPDVLKTGASYEFEKVIAEQLIAAEIAREVGRKYRRPLRDFVQVIREFKRQEPILLDRIAAATQDVAYMQAAVADAQKHAEFNEAEIAELKAESERLAKEVALAQARASGLDADAKRTNAAVKKLLAANKKLAADIARLQTEAAEKAEAAISYEQASADR
jgi:hypothetical protein